MLKPVLYGMCVFLASALLALPAGSPLTKGVSDTAMASQAQVKRGANAPSKAKPQKQKIIADGRGNSIEISIAPQRIISGSLASDEVTVELLQRTGQMQRLVALSTLVDNPRYSNLAGQLQAFPSVPSKRFGGELEAAFALRPDLVIAASINKPETLRRLNEAQVKTFVIGDFYKLADIAASITTLGELLHLKPAAKSLRHEFESDLVRLAARIPYEEHNRPVVLQYIPGHMVSGANTLFDDIVRAAGGRNAAAVYGLRGWPRVNAETLITMNPAAIVAEGLPQDRARIIRELQQTPGWRELAAVQAEKIIVVPGPQLAAVSHHVVKAVRHLQQAFFDIGLINSTANFIGPSTNRKVNGGKH